MGNYVHTFGPRIKMQRCGMKSIKTAIIISMLYFCKVKVKVLVTKDCLSYEILMQNKQAKKLKK